MDKEAPLVVGRELLENLSFCVIDLETTGGNHQFDKIIEIGLVKIENLKIVAEFGSLIEPEIPIPDFIQKLTSISPRDLKDAPTIDQIIGKIMDFIGDSILVAHNSSFDVPFLNSVLTRLRYPRLKNKSLCTNLMTKYLIPDIMNSNLNYMSRIFDIEHNQAHRALEDANATACLLLTYLDFFIDKKIKKINHLYYPRNKYELDRAHFNTDTSVNEILERITEVNSPLLLVLKGKKGVFLSTLPINNPSEEKDFIRDQLEKQDWVLLTIQMMGSFFENLIYFNHNFTKSDPTIQSEILDYLISKHVSQYDEHLSFHSQEIPDFLLTNHLIPEQFTLFPLANLQYKSEIVFRYPSHQKKLIQFIKNQSRKLNDKKNKKRRFKSFIVKELETLLANYIIELKKDSNKTSFLFDRKLPQKSIEDFQAELKKFMMQNKNTYNYPKKHI